MAYTKIQLKPGKEESLKRFHPWIFSGAIDRMESQPQEGDVVEIIDSKHNFIGYGHYQIGSITVRILTFKKEEIDFNFWKERLQVAFELRKSLGLVDGDKNNTFRLVHGEGDYIPGFIIDVY